MPAGGRVMPHLVDAEDREERKVEHQAEEQVGWPRERVASGQEGARHERGQERGDEQEQRRQLEASLLFFPGNSPCLLLK